MYNISSSSAVLTNVTLSGNHAGAFGGGLTDYESSVIVTNAVLTGNSALIGGGIFISESSPVLTNVTIVGNTVTNGGGGLVQISSSSNIRNSIIWGNTKAGNIANIASRGTPTYSYSLVQGSSSESWNTSFGADGGHNIDADPSFTDAANGDYTLKEGSPALNTGNKDYFTVGQTPDLSAITTDRAGAARIAGTIDLGAYERQKKRYTMAFSGLVDGKIVAGYGDADFSPATATP